MAQLMTNLMGPVMTTAARRDKAIDLARRLNWMDRIFEEWMRAPPLRRTFGLAGTAGPHLRRRVPGC